MFFHKRIKKEGKKMNTEEIREKGTVENPFYLLEFGCEKKKQTLRIDPYLFVDKDTLGPKLVLKDFWPAINYGISTSMPIYFWYRERSGTISMDFDGNELMRLACQVEQENLTRKLWDLEINAVLVLGLCNDKRLKKENEKEKTYITPVQFFSIDVELPKKIMKKDIGILKRYKLL